MVSPYSIQKSGGRIKKCANCFFVEISYDDPLTDASISTTIIFTENTAYTFYPLLKIGDYLVISNVKNSIMFKGNVTVNNYNFQRKSYTEKNFVYD